MPERLKSFAADVRAIDAEIRATGKPACRACRGPLPKRRRAYCSEECRIAFLVPRVWSVAVHQVYLRDKGVCALCARDTRALQEKFVELKKRTWLGPAEIKASTAERLALIRALNAEGFHIHEETRIPEDGALWQVDHIVPVVEGGGGCGLENLQTLCTPCHKAETAKLAKRRAKNGSGEGKR